MAISLSSRARQTGNSTFFRETLWVTVVFDLLNAEDLLAAIQNPKYIESVLLPNTEIVVIDEIQKAPQLLDEEQRLIVAKDVRFLLTGSSARKLRRGGINLLGGRAGTIHFHPLLARELASKRTSQAQNGTFSTSGSLPPFNAGPPMVLRDPADSHLKPGCITRCAAGSTTVTAMSTSTTGNPVRASRWIS